MSGGSRPDDLDHDTVRSTGEDESEPEPTRAPGFRAGVKVTRNSLGHYEIQDQTAGQTFVLNEYEGSLARMLDGKRPISEILDATRRLGIPINHESLQKFIQRLDGFGVLGTSNEADAKAAWASRGAWETSVRTLFQSGIRLLRQRKYSEAAGYFEALLGEDPENIEARELLAMAHSGAAEAAAQRPRPALLIPAPQPARGSWFRVVAIALMAALVIGGGVLASQLLRKPDATPTKVAVTPASIDATPRPAAVVIDAAPPPAAIVIDAAQVAPIDAGAASAVVESDDKSQPKPVAKPRSIAQTTIKAPTAGKVTAFLRGPRNVKKGDRLFEIVHVSGDPAAIKAIAAKVADLEAMAKQDPTTYEAFLVDARKELETTRGATSSLVVAPRAGYATPHVKSGSEVKAGQLLVVIEYSARHR